MVRGVNLVRRARRGVFETCRDIVPSLQMHDMFERPIGRARVADALSIVGFIGSEWQCSNTGEHAASKGGTNALLRPMKEAGLGTVEKKNRMPMKPLACSRGQEM